MAPHSETVIPPCRENETWTYRGQDWHAAAGAFGAALNANPSDRPTQILLSRCWSFKACPPVDSWNGVTNLAG